MLSKKQIQTILELLVKFIKNITLLLLIFLLVIINITIIQVYLTDLGNEKRGLFQIILDYLGILK